MDFSGTFDSTNALSCMFLWLIFGFLTALVNCDIQRFLLQNPLAFHAFGFLAFLFLFTLLDTNNTSSIGVVWAKSIFVYIIFVLMTKSKWYFVLPVLLLLLIDQSIKKQVAFAKAAAKEDEQHDAASIEKWDAFQKTVTEVINYVIIALILLGTLDYIRLQRREYMGNFSFYKFFLTTKNECKKVALDYSSIPDVPTKGIKQ